MEAMCQLGRRNSELQSEIDSMQEIVDKITQAIEGQAEELKIEALACVAKYYTDKIEIKVWEKDRNRQQMTNYLVQAII